MVRIAIDPHMFGEEWFTSVRGELVRCRGVRFAYTGVSKERVELSKQRDALRFYKLMGDSKRRDDAHEPTIVRYYSELTSHETWLANSKLCDDGHLFALVRALPTDYVFSKDDRMAKCRDCLSGKISSSYLKFSVIKSHHSYLDVRSNIISG
jgi:hypothetical protein